ncbi:MAG TPA: hypothetical protein VJM51_00960 [Dehalococcoidia bacterium]|nr:hypothetical protein [Dehalococcoidia bacterium]
MRDAEGLSPRLDCGQAERAGRVPLAESGASSGEDVTQPQVLRHRRLAPLVNRMPVRGRRHRPDRAQLCPGSY